MKTFKQFREGITPAITPKDFTPWVLRGVPHIRTKEVRDQEMKHFRQFIQGTGGHWFVKTKSKQKVA